MRMEAGRPGRRHAVSSDNLGDQFAPFADELREWAELDLVAGLEGWPDGDWEDD